MTLRAFEAAPARTPDGLPPRKNAASPTPRPSCWRIASVRSGPIFLASGPAASMPVSARDRARKYTPSTRQALLSGRRLVHPVAELAAAALGRGNGAHLGARLFQQLGEDGESPSPGNARTPPASESGCADRACRCRICSIAASRKGICGQCRRPPCGPPPNSSNTPWITGWIVSKTSCCSTKLISMSSW